MNKKVNKKVKAVMKTGMKTGMKKFRCPACKKIMERNPKVFFSTRDRPTAAGRIRSFCITTGKNVLLIPVRR